MLKHSINMLSLCILANLFSGIHSVQAMESNTPKVRLIAHQNLIGYYLCDKGTVRIAAQIMPGNARAAFDPDSYVAVQEQQRKTIQLQDPHAIYNELKALYEKQQQQQQKAKL